MPAGPRWRPPTSRAPSAAPLAIVSVAVSCVADPTDTMLTVTPVPLRATVAPTANPVPLIVTGTAAPGVPWFGDTEVTVTAAPVTVNPPTSVPLPPLELVTVTSRAPAVAVAEIVSVAVSCVADTKVRFDTVMPVPLRLTVEPALNPAPLIVTGIAVAGAP